MFIVSIETYHYKWADCRKQIHVLSVAVSVFADLFPPEGLSVIAPKASSANLFKALLRENNCIFSA